MEYKEAMAKVFGKQQAFSCCQQRRSRKNPAQVKWVVSGSRGNGPGHKHLLQS